MTPIHRTKLYQSLLSLSILLGLVGIYFSLPSLPLSRYPVEALDLGNDHDDSGGLAAVQALPNAAWMPVDTRQLSYLTATERTVWLRVKIPASEHSNPLVAEIATPYLKKVDFYLVQNGRVVAASAQGMDRPFADRPYHFVTQAFGFKLSEAAATDLYVRATSSLFVFLPFTLTEEAVYADRQVARISLLATMFGIYCGLLLYNIFIFINLRDRANLYNTFFQLAVFVVGLTITGGGFNIVRFLSEDFAAATRCTGIALCCAAIGMGLFLRELAALKRTDPNVDKAVIGYILFAAVVAIPLVIYAPLAVAMTLVVALLLIGGLCASFGSLLRGTTRNEFYFHLSLDGLGTLSILWLLPFCGLIPSPQGVDLMIFAGGIWQAVGGSSVLTNRIRVMQAERRTIIKTLKNQQPASQLNGLLNGTYIEAQRELSVSIMFIDIVGFSQLGKLVSAHEVLNLLKVVMNEMTAVVEAHGGMVDRSLGDGILCFFGYNDRATLRSHEQEAFDAATEIQRRIVKRVVSAPPATMILPVRIGIHTDRVLIGDLGGKDRIDFTLIGNGVNFASRLETACTPFKVMLSTECRERLTRTVSQNDAFNEILVAVKHVAHLVTAFEFNPFAGDDAVLQQVEQRYLAQIKVSAKDQRFPVSRAPGITLEAAIGSFPVSDFSAFGFRTLGQLYLGQKVTLLVKILTHDATTDAKLRSQLLSSFHVEVRWSRKTLGGFEHGFKIYGFTPEQSSALFAALIELEHRQDHLQAV